MIKTCDSEVPVVVDGSGRLYDLRGLGYQLKEQVAIEVGEARGRDGKIEGYIAQHTLPNGTDEGETVRARGRTPESAARGLIVMLGRTAEVYEGWNTSALDDGKMIKRAYLMGMFHNSGK